MGLGADVLSEYAALDTKRAKGLVLINPCCSKVGYLNWAYLYRDVWALQLFGINDSVLNQCINRLFSPKARKNRDLIEFYKNSIKKMKPKNVKNLVKSYLNKTDQTSYIASTLKIPILLCSGDVSQMKDSAEHFHKNIGCKEFITFDGAGSLISEECTTRLSESCYLFMLSLGISLPYIIFKHDN